MFSPFFIQNHDSSQQLPRANQNWVYESSKATTTREALQSRWNGNRFTKPVLRSFFKPPQVRYKIATFAKQGKVGSFTKNLPLALVRCTLDLQLLQFSATKWLDDSGYSLGTHKHEEVYNCIEENTIEGGRATALDLSECVHQFELCQIVGPKVRYTKQGVNGNFYKILRHDRFKKQGPEPWRDLYNVYKKLGEIVVLPESLLPAKLYYGEYQVAIEMPFCSGATQCHKDITQQQKEDLLAAIVALGKVGLCYVDFHPQNLLITANRRLRLVDYDDMTLHQDEREVKDAYREMKQIMFDGMTHWDEVQDVVQLYTSEIQEEVL